MTVTRTEITSLKVTLPHYLRIYREADSDSDTVKVTIESSIYVNRKREMPHSWSIEWVAMNPDTFVGEILSFCVKAYQLKKQPTMYR